MEFPNYISLFIYAFFMMLSSPILLDMGTYFNISPENMNLVMTFFNVGVVSGIIALYLLSKKLKNKTIIIWTHILLLPALAGLILTESLILFYILYFISGSFIGMIFMNANTSIIEGKVENKNSIVNLGYSFFAMGAFVSPFFSSSIVKNQINWKFIYFAVIFLVFLSLVLYIYQNKKLNSMADPIAEKKAFSIKDLLRNRKIFIYLVITIIPQFFYVMSEVMVFSWTPTFFRIEKLFDLYSASFMISIFWAGILAGRLMVSFLSYRFRTNTLLIALAIISVTGLFLVIFPASRVTNYIGAAITGLGFSGIPPLLISSAGRISSSGKDLVLTIFFSIGTASGSLIPFMIKALSRYGNYTSMVIAIIGITIVGIFAIVRRHYKKTLKEARKIS